MLIYFLPYLGKENRVHFLATRTISDPSDRHPRNWRLYAALCPFAVKRVLANVTTQITFLGNGTARAEPLGFVTRVMH